MDNPNAVLSGFANPKMGEWINGAIDADLKEKGAFLILVGRSECLNDDQADSEKFIRGPIEHMLQYSQSLIEIDSKITHEIASKFDVFIKNDSHIESLREHVSNLKIIANRKWIK